MQQMYGNYGFGNPGYGMAGPYMERFHQQMAAQQQRPMELVRVTGTDGAKAFQMPPNSTAALFDDSQDIFFVKSTDGAGFPTIRTFSFAPYEPAAQPQTEYVTRAEFERWKEEIINGQQPVRKSGKAVAAAAE